MAESSRSLLFAGGIGITPILAMAQALAARGEAFELHYCVRSRRLAAFIDWLEASPFAAHVHLHADDGPTPFDAPALLRDAGDAHLYVCGPGGFMEHVLGCARAAGWDETRLHREYFAAPVQPTGAACAFEVRLARSGLTLQVPAERSVAQVLDDAGVCIPLACEQGICGTCLTRVLDGEPEHRDSFLTDAERARNDQFTPAVRGPAAPAWCWTSSRTVREAWRCPGQLPADSPQSMARSAPVMERARGWQRK